jgi:two-component system response regulator MprA
MNVLLVEDDDAVARLVREGLGPRGYKLHHVSTVAAARNTIQSRAFDAVILDLALPDGSGLDLAAALRSVSDDPPILMLTALNSVQDRVAGFQRGADDYLCKPFEVEELAARLEAILRRTRSGKRHVLRYADVALDLMTRTVERGSVKATLSAREMDLLAYLLRHPEEALPRERILNEVWGDEAEDDSNVLNVYVNYLRNKIEPGSLPTLIHTVRGVGYMLSSKEPDEVLHPTGQHA